MVKGALRGIPHLIGKEGVMVLSLGCVVSRRSRKIHAFQTPHVLVFKDVEAYRLLNLLAPSPNDVNL